MTKLTRVFRRKQKQRIRLGFDIGRVVTNGSEEDLLKPVGGAHMPVRKSFLGAPAVPGAFKNMGRVVERWGAEAVWLISACDASVENKVRAWLEYREFFRATGVRCDHVIYCSGYADKAPIALRLNLTDFVDDRPDALKPMKGTVARRYLFRSEPSVVQELGGIPPGVIVAPSTWRGLVVAITQAIDESR